MAPLTASAVAPTHGQPEVQEAMDTVERQLEAFRRDDYAAAYTHASAEIQAFFDLPAFERMVRTGYPEIARSARASLVEPTPCPTGASSSGCVSRGRPGAPWTPCTRWSGRTATGASTACWPGLRRTGSLDPRPGRALGSGTVPHATSRWIA